jgi:tRNA G46 methylase TrmB
MTMSEAPNRDQAALWNNAAADTWLEMEAVLDRLFAPIAAAVVEAGFPGEGGRILDIGCGGGATTLSMARRLGPEGSCRGVDARGVRRRRAQPSSPPTPRPTRSRPGRSMRRSPGSG